jgi:hypothetical protein
VIIGASAEGKKEPVGLADGIRESAQSWKELLLDLKRRGLTINRSTRSSSSPTGRSALEGDRRSVAEYASAALLFCTKPPMS